MKVYVVIIEDRHSDTDVVVFSSEYEAVEYATGTAKKYCRHPEYFKESLNDAMIKSGWKYHATYSCEGDNVRVLERELHPAD